MKRIRLHFGIGIAVALIASCGNDMPFDPEDPRLDDARLEIVGSPAVNLRYGETAELRVRYVAGDGSVISNAPIDYEIAGEPAGSRLAALQTTTNADGEAAVDLTAGDADAMFDVTVTPPMGDAVAFSVAVSDTDAGSIVVSMTYAGSRTFGRFDTYLFEGETCDSMNPRMLPTALRSAPSVSDVSAMPAFAGVPAGSDYAVAVTAGNEAGVGAFGCRDGVVVNAGEETPVNITLMDIEIRPTFVGVWDLDNRFDFGDALGSVGTVIRALEELGDDYAVDPETGDPADERLTDTDMDGRPEYGVDPGAFVVDLAMRQTCAWRCLDGETYDTCSVEDHELGDLKHLYLNPTWFTSSGDTPAESRFTGGCGAWSLFLPQAQTAVNDAIASRVPDFAVRWLELTSDLASAITNAHILSVLTINAPSAGNEFELPMSHELVQMVVRYRDPMSDPPGAMRETTISLVDAGFTSLEVTDITTVDGTTLTIPEHSFTLNWGELVLYIYREVLLREAFGVSDTGELLASWVDCASLASDLHSRLGDPGVVTESQLETWCGIGLEAAGTLLEGQLAGLLDIDGTLTIGGTADGSGIDESTGQVDTLENGMWSGTWGDGTETESITGTFTGARRTGM
jgi:hypothetical protein